jgi:hypothetical protein
MIRTAEQYRDSIRDGHAIWIDTGIAVAGVKYETAAAYAQENL